MIQADARGLDTLARTTAQARRDLADLRDPHRAAAALVAAAGDPPRVTGYLASATRTTTTAQDATVAWTAPYASVIHDGWQAHNIRPNPWTDRAVARSGPALEAIYDQHASRALSRIRGT